MIKKLSFILIISFCLFAQSCVVDGASLLFMSGFEGTTSLEDYATYYTNIEGVDGDYTWPDDLPGNNSINYFYYGVAEPNDWSTYNTNEIISATGPNGISTNVLHLKTLSDLGGDGLTARIQYDMWASSNELDEGYVSYWMKFPDTLSADMPDNTWRMIQEWFETGSDYAFNLQIIKHTDSEFYWKLRARFTPSQTQDWQELNGPVDPPIDEWFFLEVYWKISTDEDGIIRVWVNGDQIFNHIGHNALDSGVGTYMPFKVYSNEWTQEEWIDDFQMWDGIPQTFINVTTLGGVTIH